MANTAQILVRIAHELSSVSDDLTRIAAGNYKDKRVIKVKGEEKTIYEYSDRQVSRRQNEKATRLETLKKSLTELRTKYRADLTASDPKTRLIALAIGLIDETYERVGNDTSAKERGHYGVTGWECKHIKWEGGKAVIRYVGKSGVKQEKTVEAKPIIRALKEQMKGKDPGDCLFFHKGDDREFKLSAADVNSYLKDFDISAKDLRGLHANREMADRLRAIRKENGALPKSRDEKKEQLKNEFEKVLKDTAEAVGHEPATLRTNYLVPNMEDQYLKHGEVPTKWDD